MLEQPRQQRQRAASLYVNAPTYLLYKKAAVTSATTPSAATAIKMSYHRPLSPGRRIQNPARASDSFGDSYSSYNTTQGRHNSYQNPRSSAGVIPISTQTFVTMGGGQPAGTTHRPEQRYDSYTGKPMVDSYSGRPRRSSLVDGSRGSSTVTQAPSRSTRPTVVQNNDYARPASPVKTTTRTEYYVTPASTTQKEQPRPKVEHKKLYAVDDGGAKLVADVDVPVGGETSRHHRRRDSVDRGVQSRSMGGGYGQVSADRERGRERRSYHANGTRPRDKSIDDDDAYSYTDAAGMYRDTEPRWRDVRPRRGSMDRGGASRERPVSMMVEVGALGAGLSAGLGAYADPRSSNKEIGGPPPSTRGWDKIQDLGRTRSARIAQSPTRSGFLEPRDPYYVPPRAASRDGRPRANSRDSRPLAVHQDRLNERSGYDDYDYTRDRESRREQRSSGNRRTDQSIERRGFGIRSSSRDDYGRGSDENSTAQKTHPRDSVYVEPHRREPAPEISHQDYGRPEQERKDRERVQQTDRGYDSTFERERPREHERARERDHKYDDRQTDRERERQRMLEREPEREHRHHHRRETADKEREHRKENGDSSSSGVAKVATGGLAGAAAAFGLNKIFGNNDKDKDRDSDKENKERERERERDRDRAREKERERERERDRDRDRDREKERERDRDRERERERDRDRDRYDEPPRAADRDLDKRTRDQMSYSDDSAPHDRPHRDPYVDQDQGLGFAFEKQPPSKAGQPSQPDRRDREKDRAADRDLDQEGFGKSTSVEMPKPAIDPDEDYRRRMEQVQRELGRGSQDERDGNGSGSDADRERRRREREARAREREFREPKLDAGVGLASFDTTAPPPQLRREVDEISQSTAPSATGDLKRKPSILDGPMTAEPIAQIIDNSYSDKRENRVRIVDPPTEEEEKKPKGILKKPTDKFPEDPNALREGVAPLKDVRHSNTKSGSSAGGKGNADEEQATKKGIPPGARWTKIDRRLVNPEALIEANERFEERLDCVIVLRVLTKEEIQKLADRTRKIRDDRYEQERAERKALRRRERNKDRRERDEYTDDSEDEYAERAPKMLEAPSTVGASTSTYDAGGNADFVREAKDRREQREGERERQYMSGGLGRRPEEQAYAQQQYPGQGYPPPPPGQGQY